LAIKNPLIVLCCPFAEAIALAPFDLSLVLIAICELDYTFGRTHLVVNERTEILGSISEDHHAEPIENIVLHLTHVDD